MVDPDGSARHAEEDFGRRWLNLAPMLDGMHSIDGVLIYGVRTGRPSVWLSAPAHSRVCFSTLDAPRTHSATHSASSKPSPDRKQLPTLSGATTAIQVEVDLATLTGDQPHPGRLPGCGRPSVHTDAHHLVPWAQGGQIYRHPHTTRGERQPFNTA